MLRMALYCCTAALLLSGCAAPTHQDNGTRPALPDHYRGAVPAQAQDAVSQTWWRGFGSETLNTLIEAAQMQSQDLAAAIARVRQAQASARIAGAALLPELSANAAAGHQGRLGGSGNVNGRGYSVGLTAGYEVDFWGGNRAASLSAQQALQASRYDQHTVALTLTAGVASAWVQLMALRERVDIASLNLESAQRLETLVRAQFEAGAATALALAQQRTLLAGQWRQLEAIREQAKQGATALMTLIGQATELTLPAEPLSSLTVPSVRAGLPSMLLARRPDIAAAEARLKAADADIAVARAAMLPSLKLTATAGGESRHWGELLASPVYSLAAGLAAPIFNAGRLSAQHDLAIARREELLALYHKAIVAAFGDTQTALDHLAGVRAQRQAQSAELEQARLALALAESRYRAGAETLIVLLDAQRSLYAAQDDAVQLHADEIQAVIGVYRALGGGWSGSQ